MAASKTATESAPPLSLEEFSDILKTGFGQALCGVETVAVGVSGGPDSMALLKLLSLIAEHNPGSPKLKAITVDHGLRAESAAEAEQVADWVKDWTGVEHKILKWQDKPGARIQEEARHARYDLMADYCAGQGIKHLFVAHHMDDQAETVLFRLAKGSGLDGLSGMRTAQAYGDLVLLRPFLEVPKDRLLATCEAMAIPFVKDPSNEAEKFARVRLRKSAEILGEEGLTAKRLAVTAKRLGRARRALDDLSHLALTDIILVQDTKHIVLNYARLVSLPEELALRCLLKCTARLRPNEDYAPRMEKIEDLLADLLSEEAFRKRTLGGLIFEKLQKKGEDHPRLVIELEA